MCLRGIVVARCLLDPSPFGLADPLASPAVESARRGGRRTTCWRFSDRRGPSARHAVPPPIILVGAPAAREHQCSFAPPTCSGRRSRRAEPGSPPCGQWNLSAPIARRGEGLEASRSTPCPHPDRGKTWGVWRYAPQTEGISTPARPGAVSAVEPSLQNRRRAYKSPGRPPGLTSSGS